MTRITGLRNVRWNNPEHTRATGIANIENLPGEHPYTVDVREFPDLINNIAAGEYGAVEEYVDVPVVIDWVSVDQRMLNEMLEEKGSVLRAVTILMFKEINKLRVKNGDPAYTMTQFKTALAAEQARG